MNTVLVNSFNLQQRYLLCDWLFEVTNTFKLREICYHRAIVIFDHYADKTVLDRKIIQCVGCACLCIASKYEEIYAPSMDDFVYVSDNAFRLHEITETEEKILLTLHGFILFDTPYQYFYKNNYEPIKKNFVKYVLTIMLSSRMYVWFDVTELVTKIGNMYDIITGSTTNTVTDSTTNTVIDSTTNAMTNSITETTQKKFNDDIDYQFILLTIITHKSSKINGITSIYLKDVRHQVANLKLPEIKCEYNTTQIISMYTNNPDKKCYTSLTNCVQSIPVVKYEAPHKLGTGSYGDVSKIKLSCGESIAVKNFSSCDIAAGISHDALREITSLSCLTHDNIVKYYGCHFNYSQQLCDMYMEIMEYTLQDYVERNKFTIDRVTKINFVKQLISAVNYIHDKQISHRDLTYKNIMIKNNTLKIIDFGMARKISSDTLCYSDPVGTIHVMPIELLLGRFTCSFEIDVWSCGCIIYYIMMGCYPFVVPDSSIDAIFRILRILGTPDKDLHPYLCNLPNYNSTFPKWEKKGFPLFSSQYPLEHDLVEQMFNYDFTNRITINKVYQQYVQPHIDQVVQSNTYSTTRSDIKINTNKVDSI